MTKQMIMALVAATLTFFACSKSNSNPTQKSMEGTGTWQIESILAVQTDPLSGILDTVFYSWEPPAQAYENGQVIFDGNDTAWWHIVPLNSDTAIRYRVLNSQTFVQGLDTMHIQTLSDSLFIFYQQEAGYKETFTLIPDK
jgi:hypothetical protein